MQPSYVILLCLFGLFGADFALPFNDIEDGGPKPLYQRVQDDEASRAACDALSNSSIVWCKKVDIDFEALLDGARLIFPGINEEVFLERKAQSALDDAFTWLEYDSDLDDSAMLTVSDDKEKVSGNIRIGDRVFSVHNCGFDCHVLAEEDAEAFADEVTVAMPDDTWRKWNEHEMAALERAQTDEEGVAVVSVKIYYTKALKRAVPDVQGFANLAIAETNAGYRNSGIKIKLKLHCVEQTDINEGAGGSSLLSKFRVSKRSFKEIRGGADLAILMVDKLDFCGIAYTDVLRNGQTLGVVKRSCAVGYYSFGHEIAHMYGSNHNREAARPRAGEYAFGLHIRERNGRPSGFRTVLAYSGSGFRTRVNRYSNARVRFGGRRTGDSQNDNARLLNERRFLMQNVDNERRSC